MQHGRQRLASAFPDAIGFPLFRVALVSKYLAQGYYAMAIVIHPALGPQIASFRPMVLSTLYTTPTS